MMVQTFLGNKHNTKASEEDPEKIYSFNIVCHIAKIFIFSGSPFIFIK